MLIFKYRYWRFKKFQLNKVRLCCVMGSGGHTTEMINLLKEMNGAYSPRIYIIAETDQMSQQKVRFFRFAQTFSRNEG